MSQPNAELVRSLYAAFAKGDVPAVLGAMDPGIVWNEAENFPYADGNPYVGPMSVAQGVFARLGGEWEGFGVVLEEVLDAGETVVALGRYVGTYRKTGKSIRAQFAHVWRLESGRIRAFQQYTDTAQAQRAVNG